MPEIWAPSSIIVRRLMLSLRLSVNSFVELSPWMMPTSPANGMRPSKMGISKKMDAGHATAAAMSVRTTPRTTWMLHAVSRNF